MIHRWPDLEQAVKQYAMNRQKIAGAPPIFDVCHLRRSKANK
jgi:hypothetical protein